MCRCFYAIFFLCFNLGSLFSQTKEELSFLNESLDLFRQQFEIDEFQIYFEESPILMNSEDLKWCSKNLEGHIDQNELNHLFSLIDDSAKKGFEWQKGDLQNVKILSNNQRSKLLDKNSKRSRKALKKMLIYYNMTEDQDWLSSLDSIIDNDSNPKTIEDFYNKPKSERYFWYLSYPVIDFKNGFALLGFGGGDSLMSIHYLVYLLKKENGKWVVIKPCYDWIS